MDSSYSLSPSGKIGLSLERIADIEKGLGKKKPTESVLQRFYEEQEEEQVDYDYDDDASAQWNASDQTPTSGKSPNLSVPEQSAHTPRVSSMRQTATPRTPASSVVDPSKW